MTSPGNGLAVSTLALPPSHSCTPQLCSRNINFQNRCLDSTSPSGYTSFVRFSWQQNTQNSWLCILFPLPPLVINPAYLLSVPFWEKPLVKVTNNLHLAKTSFISESNIYWPSQQHSVQLSTFETFSPVLAPRRPRSPGFPLALLEALFQVHLLPPPLTFKLCGATGLTAESSPLSTLLR